MFRKMREFIPVDIHKSNLKQLIMQGLPQPLAVRIWQTKILWLICMHKDDIYKVYLYVSHVYILYYIYALYVLDLMDIP